MVCVRAGSGYRRGEGGAGGLEQTCIFGDGRYGHLGGALQTGSQVRLSVGRRRDLG